MSIRSLFTDDDLERMREATAGAESGHAGEIVPYLVGRVDPYNVVYWRAATIGALLSTMIAALLYLYGSFGWSYGIAWILLPVPVGVTLGFLLARIPAIGRTILVASDIDPRVIRRAEAAFLEEEVFKTRDRTGILIFIAVYEHRAVILGDEGINRAVPEDTWQNLVDALVTGIREGRAVEAVTDTIERCGQILDQYEVDNRSNNRNELSNEIRLRES